MPYIQGQNRKKSLSNNANIQFLYLYEENSKKPMSIFRLNKTL